MPWICKRYRMTPQMEKQLLGISARQIDRRLKAKKSERKRRTKPGSLLKHHIPVKTDSWDVSSPGSSEVDLVSHSGKKSQTRLFHRACKSRKKRAIRTFPQPRRRRVFDYIFNVSTVGPKVTLLNGLTR